MISRSSYWSLRTLIVVASLPIYGMPNLTRNDQFPLYSSLFPYSYLTERQKASLMRFDYRYAENRFRVSVSGFNQSACRARNLERDSVNLGDINGRWNMLGLFYDPALRDILSKAIGTTIPPLPDPIIPAETSCQELITQSNLSDPNKEFGFFSIPIKYSKRGVRFESQILLIDRCYYAVGLEVQWGISEVRQTVKAFEDFTGQALGKAYPAASARPVYGNTPVAPNTTGSPPPVMPTAVVPPFVDPNCIPQAELDCLPRTLDNCPPEQQVFQPLADATLALGFTPACKQFVIENIMNKKDVIADVLGLNICNYQKFGLDDARVSLFWRQIFIINEDDENYPRVLFMPFAQVGVGIPMTKEVNNRDMFAVPIGNNHHTYVGGVAGFTLDFLDTIEISGAGGFSYFFKRDYCNFRLPTNFAESGIFPYAADVTIQPGPTWHMSIGMNAWRFLDNLSAWAEYSFVSHTEDDIKVCRSFIPQNSLYFEKGFDVKRAECFSQWEVHLANVALNYDVFDCLSIGFLAQIPIKQRNAYRSTTFLGTITFTY